MDPDDIEFELPGLAYNTDYNEPDARSSPGPHSSPVLNRDYSNASLFLLDDPMEEEGASSDSNFEESAPRAPALTNEQKAEHTLAYMKTMNKFSLHTFFETMFMSTTEKISHAAGIFESNGGILELMEIWWNSSGGARNQEMVDWVIEKAAQICSKEASRLSERAAAGRHAATAASLRVSPEDITVEMVTDFRLKNLTKTYNRIVPQMQKIFRAIIGKDEERDVDLDYRRDPTAVRYLKYV
ncbi:hypothetical protein D9619_008176 [Psilocybe cf. subviscida]|uniref:Uncharacterized protein n=1 Tax=Psilocybe cf. subviscida TaxID=2480587 RepID=A0A8H5ESG3_9AGAR|nr:hypothetical protein D9619_008176 [Psilocybe cf. subviscida]